MIDQTKLAQAIEQTRERLMKEKDAMNKNDIFKAVLNAMQSAEEMGGPEGKDYLVLMTAIREEAQKRINTYTASVPA
jgi:hypothetical protein